MYSVVRYPFNLDAERYDTVWYVQPESICRATMRKVLCYIMVFVKGGDVLGKRERTGTLTIHLPTDSVGRHMSALSNT